MMMSEEEKAARMQEVADLEEALSASLAGHNPDAIGAALGEMVNRYLLGHHPSIRPNIKQKWFKLLEDLLENDIAAADEVHRRADADHRRGQN